MTASAERWEAIWQGAQEATWHLLGGVSDDDEAAVELRLVEDADEPEEPS